MTRRALLDMDSTEVIKKLALGFLFVTSPIFLAYGAISGRAIFVARGVVFVEQAAHPGWYALIMFLHLIISIACVRWLFRISTAKIDDSI
jgi:hypothetical protein